MPKRDADDDPNDDRPLWQKRLDRERQVRRCPPTLSPQPPVIRAATAPALVPSAVRARRLVCCLIARCGGVSAHKGAQAAGYSESGTLMG